MLRVKIKQEKSTLVNLSNNGNVFFSSISHGYIGHSDLIKNRNTRLVQANVSQVTQQLYQSARVAPMENFKLTSFDLIQKLIFFDFSTWTTVSADGKNIHSNQIFDRENELNATCTNLDISNETINEFIASLGQTLVQEKRHQLANQPDVYSWVLRIARVNPVNGLYTIISLYRKSLEDRFSKSECNLVELLHGHMIEANEHNYCHQLYTKQNVSPSALCDFQGVLYSATPGFEKLLKFEWPNESYHFHLSTVVKERVTIDGKDKYLGNKIILKMNVCNTFIYLEAKLDQRNSCLTVRQREICQQLILGRPEKVIASKLGAQVKTINNHLNAIYKKFDVHSKTQLIKKFSDNRVKLLQKQ